jgi:hypothetical protein
VMPWAMTSIDSPWLTPLISPSSWSTSTHKLGVHDPGAVGIVGDPYWALAAVGLLDHLARSLRVPEEDSTAVERVDAVVVLWADVEQSLGLGNSGVGDHDVKVAELAGGLRHEKLHVARAGQSPVTPLASISFRVASSSDCIDATSDMAMSCPSWAKRRAMALPMPQAVAPVTCGAVFLLSFFCMVKLWGQ